MIKRIFKALLRSSESPFERYYAAVLLDGAAHSAPSAEDARKDYAALQARRSLQPWQ